MQIDDTISKASTVLRKLKSIKNSLTPINRIPPETLSHTATFLVRERDLIDATAVCRHWRTILLSFPRLWRNAGGSFSELEAYLERSKSVPIEVDLSSPHLAPFIIPHTFRLVALTICVKDSSCVNQIAEHLRGPIPTLRSLDIRTRRYIRTLELPSGLCEGLFRYLKRLSLSGISSFSGPQTFPHITELFLRTVCLSHRPAVALLKALEQLPGLVKVSVIFQNNWYIEIRSPDIVTLPCVQEMDLSASIVEESISTAAIPPLLRFLKLPKATSITIPSPYHAKPDLPILPVTSFGDQLPNYVELPELRIDAATLPGKVVFRSPSQAVFTYHCGALWDYERERRLWGDLPLSSVRKVTAVLAGTQPDKKDVWLVDLLEELDFLELLELEGDCGQVLRCLRRRLVRGVMRINIKTLIVHGGEYAKTQALKFESAKDDLGLENMTVTYYYIPDPEARGSVQNPDVESSTDDIVWDVDLDSDDEGGGEDE